MSGDSLENDFRVGAGCRTMVFWALAGVILGGLGGYGFLEYQFRKAPQEWGMGVILALPLYLGMGVAGGLILGVIIGAMRADFKRARRQSRCDGDSGQANQ